MVKADPANMWIVLRRNNYNLAKSLTMISNGVRPVASLFLTTTFPRYAPMFRGYAARPTATTVKQRQTVQHSYRVLEVTENSTAVEIKEAFIRLAKKYHPDSSDTPNEEKFRSIETAYREIVESRKVTNPEDEMEDISERDLGFTYKAAAHRQYLSNEGFGYGTPSQREKQYQTFRLNRATDRAFNYRMDKTVRYTEDALVTLDKKATKKFRTQNAIERVVEDLIQESMAKGEFQKLSGMGKPLNYSDANPFIDSMTHKLNRILINNGFVPEWAMLGKEIETLKIELRHRLTVERASYGEKPSERDLTLWNEFVQTQQASVKDINTKINKFNFVCPSIQQQLCPVTIDLFAKKIFEGDQWRNVPASEIQARTVSQSREHKRSGANNGSASPGKTIWDLFL